MFNKLPLPITEENYEIWWKYVYGKVLTARKKYIIERVVLPIGNIVFLLCCLVLMYGFLYTIDHPMLHEFVASLPVFPDLWNRLFPLISRPEWPAIFQLLWTVLVAYLIPVIACLVPSVIIFFAYRTKKLPGYTGDPETDSFAMFNMAREAKARKERVQAHTYFWCHLVFLLTYIIIMALFLFLTLADGNLRLFLDSLLLVSSTDLARFVLAPFVVYAIVTIPFGQILKLFYLIYVPKLFIRRVRTFFYEMNPEEAGRIEAENAILRQAQEIRERREEELNYPKKFHVKEFIQSVMEHFRD